MDVVCHHMGNPRNMMTAQKAIMTFDLVRTDSGFSGGRPCLRLVAEAMVATRFVVSLLDPGESLEDCTPPSLLDMIKAFLPETKTRSESWRKLEARLCWRSRRMIDTCERWFQLPRAESSGIIDLGRVWLGRAAVLQLPSDHQKRRKSLRAQI